MEGPCTLIMAVLITKIIIIIIIIKIFIAHSYQFKIASKALKVCKRL